MKWTNERKQEKDLEEYDCKTFDKTLPKFYAELRKAAKGKQRQKQEHRQMRAQVTKAYYKSLYGFMDGRAIFLSTVCTVVHNRRLKGKSHLRLLEALQTQENNKKQHQVRF